jgi:D-alanyl-D-alanine dipeptidase
MKKLIYLTLGLALACSAPKSDQQTFSGAQRDSLFQEDVAPKEEASSLSDLEGSFQEQGLVDIEKEIPGIQVELKYSTEDNFFKQDVYGDLTRCYLQPVAATMLAKAQMALQKEYPNLSLLVYDGVRPIRVQQILWDGLDKPDSLKPL